MTVLVRLDPERPDSDLIESAASIIRSGGLIAFPTETVYGLGADAMTEAAVLRIFEAKGRPADNPLIVHVCSTEMLESAVRRLSEKAVLLAERFWPGPLTLVLDRNTRVAASVSSGLDTVAVRMPDCRVALDLIRSAGTPVAAPSANISGRPSPTTAAHVLNDLNGRIDMILDGGTTNIGIESTVLDLTTDPPLILRPGWITREQLGEYIGQVEIAASEEEFKRSPGARHRHYRPRVPVILLEPNTPHSLGEILEKHLQKGSVGFIGHSPAGLDDPRLHTINLRNDAVDYARSIYASLREVEDRGAAVVVVQGICDKGEGAAVMDRLRRAASEIIGNSE
jgi:L-threonylcarbamoyladenylate synthase